MVHGDFEWGFIVHLNCTIILMLAHAHSVLSNAGAENAMISECITVCSKFGGILL